MKKRGFTLIEILVVIGIIGILAGIFIPVAGSAKNALTRTKTKARFNEWCTAIEQYKVTYGSYPTFGQSAGSSENDLHVNLGEGSNADAFVKTLSGRDQESGEKIKGAERSKYNRKSVSFCDFSQSDFTDENGTVDYTKLVDGFYNPSIHVVMDTTDNKRVQIPTKYLPEDATDDESNANGMLGRVIIFTSEVDGEDYTSVYSWR